MKLSFPSFTQWRAGVIAAITRFPWNMLCGITGTAALIVSIHTAHNDWLDGQCMRIAMASALGMPLFFSLRMIRERIAKFARWPIEIAGVAVLALWLWLMPSRPSIGPGIIWIQWLLLLAALHFVVAISPYFGGKENAGFWQFNRSLFLRFCLATLYTGILTAGLELAMLSANKLFQLKLGKEYGDLFFLMIGVFHPAFFLAGVPRDFRTLESDVEYPRGLKAFTQFALAPLVAVYTAILYAYAVKIITLRSWPHGWVALPVLLLSGIGILAFLLLYPLRREPEQKWAGWFTNNFPRALGPLSILLLLSVLVRIREYGVTEERYIGIVAAVWILAWALVFTLLRKSGIRWIPGSLAVIAFLAGFGPLSAGEISKGSQLRRLEQMLKAHGMWKDNHAAPATAAIKLPEKEGKDLQTTLNYLIREHGGDTIKKMFESMLPYRDWTKMKSWEGARDIVDALKVSTQDYFYGGISVNRKPGIFLNTEGFRRIWRGNVYDTSSHWDPTSCEDVRIGLEDGVLKLATGGDSTRQEVPLQHVFDRLESRKDGQLPDEDLTVDFQNNSRAFRLTFESLTFRNGPEGIRLTSCELYLLEK